MMHTISTGRKVFIIDDDAAIRDSLSLMLELEGFSVETFKNAQAFLAAVQPNGISCAIVDIRMPEMDGLQLQQALIARGLLLPIIFLTGHGDIPKSVKAIKAGAVDFLTKPITQEKLLAGVHEALRVAKIRRARIEQCHQAGGRIKTLTNREREIMLLVVGGHSSKEIARLLGISHRTVEIHRSRLMEKMGVASVLDLARITHECGLAVDVNNFA